MSTMTKTRRMPTMYRVLPGGITEICYSATAQAIVPEEPKPEVRLPGTRWLEMRRAREQRHANAPAEKDSAGRPVRPDVEPAGEESWADRISNAASRLAERQAAWISSLRGTSADLEYSPQD